MGEIRKITGRDPETVSALLSIWESAVVETHTFLSEQDIKEIKPDVEQALSGIEHLYVDADEQILGFIGVQDDKIEMLFVDAAARGKGIGKKLMIYAVDNLKARFVDVNEQNVQGVGFYQHMGFYQIKRSKRDGQGRSFPILHMEKIDDRTETKE